MLTQHAVAEVYYNLRQDGCDRCSPFFTRPRHPHNVIFRCACGQVAAGRTEHIWTVTEHGDGTASLSPSVNWLNDPQDPSKGSHLHEFTRAHIAESMAACHGVA